MTPEERAELRRLVAEYAELMTTGVNRLPAPAWWAAALPKTAALAAGAGALLDEVERLEALLEWEEGGTRRQQCPRCGAGNPAQAGYYCRMCGSLLTAERAPESAATLAAERDAFRDAISEALRQVAVWAFYPCGGARRIGVSTDDLYDADGVNVDTSQRFAKPPPPCRCGCWHASQGMPTDGALEGFRRWHREHP